MIPTPIPDELVAATPGSRRVVLSAPDGDLTNPDIMAAEALVDDTEHGARYTFRLVPEPADLAALASGGVVYVSFLGVVPPFSVYGGRG